LPSRSLAAEVGPPARHAPSPAGQPSLSLRCERRLEARGVEPLSSKRSTQPSTCLDGLCARGGWANRHASLPRVSTESNSTRPAATPGRVQPAVIASPPSRRRWGHVTAQLGREGEIFVICVCLFDPIFNEANESSSTCGPGFTLQVETITPPCGLRKTTSVPAKIKRRPLRAPPDSSRRRSPRYRSSPSRRVSTRPWDRAPCQLLRACR
jgi:hypothetical protein